MKKVFLILLGIVGVLLFASVRLLNISVVDNKTNQIDYSNLSNDDLLANAFREIQIGNLEKSYSCSRLLQEREPNNINSYLMMSIAYRLKHNLPMSLAVLESAEKTITESTDIHDQFELLFLRSLAYNDTYILENTKYLNESIQSHRQAIDFFNEHGSDWDIQEKVSLLNSLLDVLVQGEQYSEAEDVLNELRETAPDYIVTEYYGMLLGHYKHDDAAVISASKNLIMYGDKNNNKTFWWAGNLYFDYTSKSDLTNLEERLNEYLGNTNDGLVLSIYSRLSNNLKDPVKDREAIHNNIKSVLDADIEQLYESEMKPQYALYDFDITEYEKKMETHKNALYSFTFEKK